MLVKAILHKASDCEEYNVSLLVAQDSKTILKKSKKQFAWGNNEIMYEFPTVKVSKRELQNIRYIPTQVDSKRYLKNQLNLPCVKAQSESEFRYPVILGSHSPKEIK